MHLYFVSLRFEGPGSKCMYTVGHPLVKDLNQGTSCNVTFIRGGEEQRPDGVETGCRQSFLRSFVVMRTREMGWVGSGVVGALQRVCFRGSLRARLHKEPEDLGSWTSSLLGERPREGRPWVGTSSLKNAGSVEGAWVLCESPGV